MVPENDRPIDFKLWLLNELWHFKCYHNHRHIISGDMFVWHDGNQHQSYSISLEGSLNLGCAYCNNELERIVSQENNVRWNEIFYHSLGYRVTSPRVRGIPRR